MFTGGVGQMDSTHRKKGAPEKGMAVIKLGGPAYRIGMGMYEVHVLVILWIYVEGVLFG